MNKIELRYRVSEITLYKPEYVLVVKNDFTLVKCKVLDMDYHEHIKILRVEYEGEELMHADILEVCEEPAMIGLYNALEGATEHG